MSRVVRKINKFVKIRRSENWWIKKEKKHFLPPLRRKILFSLHDLRSIIVEREHPFQLRLMYRDRGRRECSLNARNSLRRHALKNEFPSSYICGGEKTFLHACPLFESSSRVLAAYPPRILSPRVIYAFPSVAPVLRDNSIKVTPAAA